MKEINSRQNVRFKFWLSLLESKGIKKEGLCIVSGSKVVREMLALGRVRDLILPPKGSDDILTSVSDPAPHVYRLHGDLFNALDVVGTGKALAVVSVSQPAPWLKSPGLNLIVALSDPNNLGACLRTAEAMGVAQVVLTKECASPFLPRALRSASGSTFRLKLASAPSLKELDLSGSGGQVFGLDLEGENLYGFVWPRDAVLIVGEEGQGLPDNLKLKRLKIPMQPTVESLNAVVATSIALFSYRGRHPL